MYAEETKRNNEHVWASVFVHEINQQNNFDYTLVPERGENSPVDLYAVSPSKQFPDLKLQLTHAVELPFMAYEKSAQANYTKQPTIDAIEHKHKKLLRKGADLSSLILIVQVYMNHETAAAVFADKVFEKFENYPFKGIYYVAPAMMSADTNESVQEGFIIPIKGAFHP
jgi:hypothetical protein